MLEQMEAIQDAIAILNRAAGQTATILPVWKKLYHARLYLENQLSAMLEDK